MFIAKPVKYYVGMYYIHNMPRNTGGGNKAKKFASKSFVVSDRATRFASVEGEAYAVVQRMLGGTICEVLCIDGVVRLCVIRGKFSGKGKRDNRLSKGTWVLVGLRDWEIYGVKKTNEELDDNCLSKERQLYIIKEGQYNLQKKHKLISLFYFNIDITQELVPDLIDGKLENKFFHHLDILDNINFKKTLRFLHNHANVFYVFKYLTASPHNTTKRVILNDRKKSTRKNKPEMHIEK
ncbi:unnamed protein product [marine sediment metagenome]|uniref:S1-like domain-containing protein n=1 Tax=marine sediment metagenome TaxID=412755 RepID=X1S3S8_9ZZZZ